MTSVQRRSVETLKWRTRVRIAWLVLRLHQVWSLGIRPMVRRQSFPKCPSGACILVLGLRGSFVFQLPPYNPSGERMAAISWNPSSFCFVIFLFHFFLWNF
jgi:hypothetical protein